MNKSKSNVMMKVNDASQSTLEIILREMAAKYIYAGRI